MEMQIGGGRGRVKRLVVVADNSLILEAITLGFRKSGEFELIGCFSGQSGQIMSIAEMSADVVLVDDLGGSDDAVGLVREITGQQGGTVIVLTVSMQREWLDTLFDAGAEGVISKATHPADLVTLVRETLHGHVIHVGKSACLSEPGIRPSVAAVQSPLTSRELEVLRLVAAGSTNGEVARKLWVTEQTVKFHLSNVYRKLHVGNRTEASRYAHVNGLVSEALPAGR